MYAIIKDNKVICASDFEPCQDDLSTRGETYISCDNDISAGYSYDGVNFYPPPSITVSFSTLQGQKRVYIKKCRDSEERSPLLYMGKLLDFDDLSSERLTWATTTAMTAKLTSQSFSVEWTTSDNSVLTMTEDDILGIPLAVATRSNIVHQKARQKIEAITLATTAEELELIMW